MKNNYREIIRKHIREYEQKLELIILDRYLFNIFAVDFSSIKYKDEFISFGNGEHIRSFVFGDPVVRFDYENVLININDIRFPFANIFKDIFVQQNPDYSYDYMDLQTEITTRVMIFEKDSNKEIFIFFNGEGMQTLYSHYDDHFFDFSEFEEFVYDPQEEINKYKEERLINGSDVFKTFITLLINNNNHNIINVVSIPENLKSGINNVLNFDHSYFRENLDKILNKINYKNNISSTIKYYDYFELLESVLEKPTIKFIVSQYMNIYNKYSKYFNDDFIGFIIQDYKNYLVEEIKITSNFIADSNYPINRNYSLKYQISEKLKEINYESNTFYRYDLEELEKMISTKSINRNFDLLNDEDIFRAIITSEWLYSKIDKKNYLDNSSVCVGYLKSIELILYKLLSKKLRVERYSTVGSLVMLLESYNNENNGLLIEDVVIDNLKRWNREVRNGFFHKDIMMKEEVEDVRIQTLKLVYDLLNSKL